MGHVGADDADMHESSATQLQPHIPDDVLSPMNDNDEVTFDSGLTSRRDLVNLLDAEPLLDYLVQNGVLTMEEMEDVLDEVDTVRQNIRLLKFIENGSNGLKLFTNVLRQTSQHYLANLVDDGTRIKALSGSGYLSKSRHKGQVGLKIRVKSMKLEQPTFKAISQLLHKDWISLEDIQLKMSSIKKLQSQSQRSSMADRYPSERSSCYVDQVASPAQQTGSTLVADDSKLTTNDENCCFCCCPYRKSKKSAKYSFAEKNELIEVNDNVNECDRREPFDVVVNYQPRSRLSAVGAEVTSECMRNGKGEREDSSMENLRNVANSIQEKCKELYKVMSDTTSKAHSQLLTYFEQECGILVLSTVVSVDALNVILISTKREQINLLRSDQTSGKLASDIQRFVTNAGVLHAVGVTGVQFQVEFDNDDLNVASHELNA